MWRPGRARIFIESHVYPKIQERSSGFKALSETSKVWMLLQVQVQDQNCSLLILGSITDLGVWF